MKSPSDPTPGSRIMSIDLFKVVGLLAVICIHSEQFVGVDIRLVVLVNQGARFAVPFFFIVSGYFVGQKLRAGAAVGKLFLGYSSRLLSIMGVWSLVYLLYPREFLKSVVIDGGLGHHWLSALLSNLWQNIGCIVEHPVAFLFHGTAEHLWFVVSLEIGLGILCVLLAFGLRSKLFLIATALYVVGLLGGSYSPTPLGLDLPFNARNGPFLSTLCMTLGYWLSQRELRVPFFWGVAITVGGMFMHFAEAILLFLAYRTPLTAHDFLIGTVPFGLGVVLMALAKPDLGRRWTMALGGKYALGVYASHILVLDVIRPLRLTLPALAWSVVCPALTYAAAVFLTVCLARVPVLRRAAI